MTCEKAAMRRIDPPHICVILSQNYVLSFFSSEKVNNLVFYGIPLISYVFLVSSCLPIHP